MCRKLIKNIYFKVIIFLNILYLFNKFIFQINPGNPTGTCLTEENIKEMIKFAYEHKMLLIADEVY